MKLKLFIWFASSLLITACQGQPSQAIRTIAPKEYSEKIKSVSLPQLIDVRTPEEFNAEHIANAKNINWNGTDFAAQAEKLDKSKPVFVYCKVGGRSGQAATKLAEMGFTEIYNLEGGIMKWNAAGLSPASGKIIGICDQEFGELVKSEPKVVVNFYAKWCEPCKKMEPYLLKMQQELQNGSKLLRFDADANKTILDQLKLDGLPVILVYENGKETWRHIGYLPEEELRKHL